MPNRKIMRHLIASVATSVLCLIALSGCGSKTSSTADSSKTKIGFIVKQPEEKWFQLEWQFADEAAKKDGFELVKIGAADGDKVLGAIDNLSAAGVAGFVICTPDVKLGPSIKRQAELRGLKLLAVDDQFIDAAGQPMAEVPYLGIEARKIGQSVGTALVDEMKKRNWQPAETGLCVVTYNELDTARQRTEGAVEAAKAAGFPTEHIFEAPQKTSDIAGSSDAVAILLTKPLGVKHWLICGMNDSAVLGAVRATEQRGLNADDVVGIGINGTECIDELKKPKTGFFGSELLQARAHGFQTAELMYKWIHDGVEPPKDTRTMGILITRDNFRDVRKEQGYQDE
ncbi:MAG TPA: arabinose ABC transporter substrate-binding protein [Pirellulales bacterium]